MLQSGKSCGWPEAFLAVLYGWTVADSALFLLQVQVVNDLQLLTAKPVTYLVNLSERDYIRKKNKWLPKIKQWIDENNPGDLLIPFSVTFEQRLADLGDEAAF